MLQADISIHAPHAGCDTIREFGAYSWDISIHAPHAGCDRYWRLTPEKPLNFNPRTPCGVRPGTYPVPDGMTAISIHAPHAGCDAAALERVGSAAISIHAPHAGCDLVCFPHCGRHTCHFNPRTPCGVRRAGRRRGASAETISIHAPHAGCDVRLSKRLTKSSAFQSTHPMRGATY